ncbi:MAG TPA: lipopolysaccharide biosynthesis protein [Allosphingosinicella sp.]|jgi:PST family polysaccharide transporter
MASFTDPKDPAPLLGRTAFEGGLYTGGSQLVRALLMILSTVLLARILTPDDFGVIAMAAPVLAFVLLFQDLGLSAVTIQARTLSDEQSSTLFWITLAVSAAVAVLMLAAAPLVGWFYQDARVTHVAAASAAVVLVTGAALQHMALLARELRFRAVAGVILAGAGVNFGATIGLAIWLQSYWAILLGNVTGAAAQSAAAWAIQLWRPGRRASLAQTRAMLGFGGTLAGFDLLNFFSRNMDNILIGRVLGSAPLGLYDRSYSLMMAPLQLIRGPVAKVMLPVMSRLVDRPQRYRLAYLSSLRAVLLVTAPAAAVAIATSEELVPLLLGARWSGASPIFFWLALGSLYLPVASSTGVLFISTGRGRSLMLWGAFSSLTAVLAFAIGLPWGPVGVAKAYVLATIVQTIIVVPWAASGTAVRARDVALLFLPFLLGAAGTWLLVRLLEGMMEPAMVVAASLPPAYAGTAALVWLFPEGRAFLGATAELVKGTLTAGGGGKLAAGSHG